MLETVRNILLKTPEQRGHQELKTLTRQVREIKFFKERTKEGQKLALSNKDIELICSGLEYL